MAGEEKRRCSGVNVRGLAARAGTSSSELGRAQAERPTPTPYPWGGLLHPSPYTHITANELMWSHQRQPSQTGSSQNNQKAWVRPFLPLLFLTRARRRKGCEVPWTIKPADPTPTLPLLASSPMPTRSSERSSGPRSSASSEVTRWARSSARVRRPGLSCRQSSPAAGRGCHRGMPRRDLGRDEFLTKPSRHL